MKLAISNIAWPAGRDAEVADLLAEQQVTGVEIAPTKIRPDPLNATERELDAYRTFWSERGIEIVAAQALLFGKPELMLFESADVRGKTLAYLEKIVRLCGRLGCGALVFGSPKNRRVGDLDRAVAWDAAVEFFGRLGETAVACDTAIVMEANPAEYGADFIMRAEEAAALVAAVNHAGFRLHLDSACMTMAGDEPERVIPQVASQLRHYHISEPQLAPIGTGGVDHARFARALRAIGYAGWASIEMRTVEPFQIDDLRRAIEHAKGDYCG